MRNGKYMYRMDGRVCLRVFACLWWFCICSPSTRKEKMYCLQAYIWYVCKNTPDKSNILNITPNKLQNSWFSNTICCRCGTFGIQLVAKSLCQRKRISNIQRLITQIMPEEKNSIKDSYPSGWSHRYSSKHSTAVHLYLLE